MDLFRSVASPLAASVDRLIARAITGRSQTARKRSRAESLGHHERVRALEAIARIYEAAEPLEDVDRFFGEPRAAAPRLVFVERRPTRAGAVTVFDARWPSRIQTFCPDIRDHYASVRQNHEAAARLFLGEGPSRPAAILIHGYRAGHYAFEQQVWPIQWLLDHGVDVALFVLPFHSVRAVPGSSPRFPASDPRFSTEGFRQAIDDLRSLLRFFRARGAPHVGAMGMSLGGYTVSLLATVDRELDFVVPIIPLASFADVALAAGRLVGNREEQGRQHAWLERAFRVVSPLSRSCKVPRGAAVVVAGQADRITPLSHAHKLAAHLGADLVTFPGGHLLQFGRADGFRAVGRMLRARGVFG